MSARSFVWLSIGGGAWGLGFNWADTTDGTSPSPIVPGAQDSVTVSGPSGTSLQTISGPGQIAAALFTGNTLLSGNFSVAALTLGQAGAGGLLELARGTALQSGSAVIVSGSLLAGAGSSLSVSGMLSLGGATGQNAALNLTAGGTASVMSLFLDGSGDSIYVDPASVLEVGGSLQGRAGQLTVDAGGVLSGHGNANAYGAVANNGTLAAQGGTLAVGTLSGTGSLVIGASATLDLHGACAAGQSVTFAGANATLALEAEFDAPSGTLTGFTAGDAIDVRGSLISRASFQATGSQGGVLTLFYGAQVAATLQLAGDYAGDVFLTSGDGAGGTLITLAPAAQGSGTAPPGTSTPDQYVWTATQSGSWATIANWTDSTLGQNPAILAPGALDLVTIAAAQDSFSVIAGPANAARLGLTGDVALTGAYAIGTLTIGNTAGPGYLAGTLDLLAGATLSAKSAIVADGALLVAGSLSALNVSGTLVLGGTPLGVGLPMTALNVTSGGVVQAASLQMGGGSGNSIVTDPTGTLEVGSLAAGTGGQAAVGAVTVDAGARLNGNGSINPYGVIIDNGTILASGGTLSLGAVSGSGSLAVAGGATLELLAATATPINLLGSAATGGSGLAFLNARAAPTGTITGLVAGDVIHLEGSPLSLVQFFATSTGSTGSTGSISTGGTLLLGYGTTIVARLYLAGNFTGGRFSEAPDGSGGSLITYTNVTGGGSGGGQTGTDQLAWTAPISGAWGRAASWTDTTTGSLASAPPGAQTPVVIAGPTGATFEAITGQGTSASLSASGNTLLSGMFQTGQLTAAAGVLSLTPATTLTALQAGIAGGQLLTGGTGALLSVSGTLALGGAGALLAAQAHSAIQCGTLSLAGGIVIADITSSIEVGVQAGAATIGLATIGAVTIDAGALATGSGSLNPAGAVIDNGTILAQAGTLRLGNVTGSGSLSIGTGATLALTGADTCPVSFTGGGATLLIGSAALPTAQITGFVAGDAIVIGNTPIDAVTFQQSGNSLGTLTLHEAGQVVGQLLLAGSYAGQAFSVQPDGAGTEITVGAQAISGPPAGTATTDTYVWAGGQGSLWANAGNWTDVTLGQTPAAVAPGLNDIVSVSGGAATTLLLAGPANAASLSLSGTVALAGNFAAGSLAVGTSAVLSLGSGGTVAAGAAAVAGGIALNGGTLSVGATLALGAAGQPGGVAVVVAGILDAGAITLAGPASSLAAAGTGSVEIGGAQGAAAGSVQVDAGGVLAGAGRVSASGAILDQGTIIAQGGTLMLGAVSGTGTLLVGLGATLVLTGTASPGLTADFAGGGTLVLTQAALAGGPAIADFGAGDQILLAAGGATSASYAQTAPGAGILTITAGTQTLAQLTLLGSQAGLAFTVAGSAGGGTILTATPDKTSGQGGTTVTNPTTSGGSEMTPTELKNTLFDNRLGNAWPEVNALVGILSANVWFSADGTPPSNNYFPDPVLPSLEIVGPLVQTGPNGSGAGAAFTVLPGYHGLIAEGGEPLLLYDNALGGDLIVGNPAGGTGGHTSIFAKFGNDTLVGAAGFNTLFLTDLAPAASGTGGYDVFIHGGGDDTIATNKDIASITTSGGRSLVFLGTANSAGLHNSVTLHGSDTVICSSGGTDDVTVNAAAGLAGDLAFGPSGMGILNFLGGNTPSTVVGTGGQVNMTGGAANGSLLWAGNSDVIYQGGGGSTAIVGGAGHLYVTGGAGPVTVFGGTGTTLVTSAAAGSALVIGDGPSAVSVGGGVNVYVTGGASTSVQGSAGANVYAGSSTGNNVFNAGSGGETLWGGLGNDLFTVADASHSLVISGGGNDTFSFHDGSNSNAVETIVGFKAGQSTIELSGYGTVAPQITYGYGDSFFHLQDGSQIIVYDVSDLTAASFVFK